MRVAIVDVVGSPYDGTTPFKRGLGGSESAVVFIARELKKLGMTVHVYNDCEGLDACPGTYDGVVYRPRSAIILQSLGYDVVIGSRSVRAFTEHRWAGKPHKVLWMHDTFCDGDELLESLVVQNKIDEIWTLSDWHTTYVSQCTHGHRRMMEVLKRKIWVTRNGVNLWEDADLRKKEKNHFVFNAAVNKGMETLLNDVWPRVKKQIPTAELTIIGGAYHLTNADLQNDRLYQLKEEHHGKNSVTFTGLISQDRVADFMSRAAYMIYPQTFPETFGISTVEALAYGTPVITGRFGAMEETAIEDACYLMDYPVDSNVLYTFDRENHIKHFVDMVCIAYDDDYIWQQKCNAALKVRDVCGWDKVALQWKQHLFKKTGHYLPKDEYYKVQRINHRTHEIFNKRWSNPEEWGFYPEKENFIEIVVPFYNASQYLSKCIESIAAQNYENFRLHLIDDASTDNSQEVIEEALSEFNIRDKVCRYINEKNVGALANQVDKIKYFSNDSIVVLLDGDDALVNNPNIFKKLNQLYHDGAEFTYGSCWSMVDNIPLVAQEYPKHIVESKTFRDYQFPWIIPYTHLRTFKCSLFDRIDDNDLRDDNGDYFKASGDTALFYALIEQARPDGIVAVRDIIHLYNDAHPNNDYKINNKEQIKNQKTILERGNRYVSTSFDGVTITKGEGKGPLLLAGRAERIANTVELPKHDEFLKRKTILIAIPTDRNIHPQTFKSIYDLKIPEGYVVDFQFFHGYRVDQVRNLIASWAIGYDYLFCVDYDISFKPDTLAKLLSHDKDMVTGLYIQRVPGQHNLELYRKDGDGDLRVRLGELEDLLEPVDGCGFGCVLIKSEVLKAVGYPQFEYHPALRMEDTISEDVDFCNKVRNLGFTIWADTTVRCGHHGMTVFEV